MRRTPAMQDPVEFRPATRRLRVPLVVAALALVMLGTVACSAAGSSSSADAGVEQVAEAAEDGSDADEGRAVIIEGSMRILVADVVVATDAATAAVQAADGRIDGRDESSGRGELAGSVSTMTLRIPATALDATIDTLRSLGSVESLQTSSDDVTTSVRDVDAHIAALESTIARLQAFQTAASSVTDLLAIEEEISARQAELEGYRAQQSDFAERIEFSTLALTLVSEPAPTAAPVTFGAGLEAGWTTFVRFGAGLAVTVGFLLPWLVSLGVIAGAIVLLVRRSRRTRLADARESSRIAHAHPEPSAYATAGAAHSAVQADPPPPGPPT